MQQKTQLVIDTPPGVASRNQPVGNLKQVTKTNKSKAPYALRESFKGKSFQYAKYHGSIIKKIAGVRGAG
jgi:hypothetical protein